MKLSTLKKLKKHKLNSLKGFYNQISKVPYPENRNYVVLNVRELFKDFEEYLSAAGRHLCYSRFFGLEKSTKIMGNRLLVRVKQLKRISIFLKLEDEANALFAMQCTINCLNKFFEAYTYVEKKDFHNAWFSTVDSFDYIKVAKRAVLQLKDIYLNGLESIEEQLLGFEKAMFPDFPFYNSRGAIIEGGYCSICNKNLEICTHVEDIIYCGQLCRRLGARVVDINHYAMVALPKDKRCIMTHIYTPEGQKRNYLTWELLDEFKEKTSDPNHLEGEMVIHSVAKDKLDWD
jgi:hypothetical protein